MTFQHDCCRCSAPGLNDHQCRDHTARAHTDVRPDAHPPLGDAHALDFPDTSFDTMVCTFSLCAIPAPDIALSEMSRVLRPGGTMLPADHVASSIRPVRWIQRALELVSVPIGGEHFLRRPSLVITGDESFSIEDIDRFTLGLVERLHARKVS